MKRYHACHCTLARVTILTGEPEINPEWCYCSAGYGKTPYEVVFGEEVEVEMLENALAGDPRCGQDTRGQVQVAVLSVFLLRSMFFIHGVNSDHIRSAVVELYTMLIGGDW